jgi:hypothetical protein
VGQQCGAKVFYGSEDSRRQFLEVRETSAHEHELGMVTFLWTCVPARRSGVINGIVLAWCEHYARCQPAWSHVPTRLPGR